MHFKVKGIVNTTVSHDQSEASSGSVVATTSPTGTHGAKGTVLTTQYSMLHCHSLHTAPSNAAYIDQCHNAFL
jgi:hypothetical protein